MTFQVFVGLMYVVGCVADDATDTAFADTADVELVDSVGALEDSGEPQDSVAVVDTNPIVENLDGDGYAADVDCDDTDPAVNPDAVETCDWKDEDCDNRVDEDVGDAPTWYADLDEDGFGGDPSVQSCVQPNGWVSNTKDCDDYNAASNPNGVEVCDEQDNDCDEVVDEEALDPLSFYPDMDADGFGSADAQAIPAVQCRAPSRYYVADNTDCDDSRDDVNPNAPEVCGWGDNDCDGLTDMNDPDVVDFSTFYYDWDQDEHGAMQGIVRETCIPGLYDLLDDWSRVADDCDDTDPDVNPDALEVCDDLVDNDCDALFDEQDDVCFY